MVYTDLPVFPASATTSPARKVPGGHHLSVSDLTLPAFGDAVGDAEEALDLGIEDAFIDAICLIEWPQRLGPFLPRTALTIELSAVEGEPDARSISVAGGARWADLLGVLRNAFRKRAEDTIR